MVWQKSLVLVSEIYKVTADFPGTEMYGLINQMRRAAVSIPSNIAEGYGRRSTGDYKRFLQISVGSLYELQTQIEISFRLSYLTAAAHLQLLEKVIELDRMMFALIKKL